jgi:hypothetical protein
MQVSGADRLRGHVREHVQSAAPFIWCMSRDVWTAQLLYRATLTFTDKSFT